MSTTTINQTTTTAGAAPPTAPPSTTAITNTAPATKTRRVDVQASYQALITGINNTYSPTYVFDIQGREFTRDELTAEFNRVILAAEATKTLNQQYRAAVSYERTTEGIVRPLRAAARGIIQAKVGASEPTMAQFGYVPTKRTKKAAQSKAAAVVRAKATRTMRNTQGKKQKAKVKAQPVTLVVDSSKSAPASTMTAQLAATPAAPPTVTTTTK